MRRRDMERERKRQNDRRVEEQKKLTEEEIFIQKRDAI
jgi:hypothetical protein